MQQVKFTQMKEGHACFDDCVGFCERWDQASFEPDYDRLPLEFFRPLLLEVFARRPFHADVLRVGAREPLTVAAVAERRAAMTHDSAAPRT